MRSVSVDRVVLFPGAGSGADHPSLVAIERAVAATDPDVAVDRVDFGYRRAGRRAPERAPKLMAEVRSELGRTATDRIVAGGRSMGGRIVSMVAAGADGQPPPPGLVAVVLVAYPLHPPGSPDRLRVEHFERLDVPCLFVSGTRDPFGSPDELTAWTASIPGPVTHHWIEGARHELRGADDEVAAVVAGFVTAIGADPSTARPSG